MALTILDDSMSSDRSPHTARRGPYMPSLWEVSWLPGQYLDRNRGHHRHGARRHDRLR